MILSQLVRRDLAYLIVSWLRLQSVFPSNWVIVPYLTCFVLLPVSQSFHLISDAVPISSCLLFCFRKVLIFCISYSCLSIKKLCCSTDYSVIVIPWFTILLKYEQLLWYDLMYMHVNCQYTIQTFRFFTHCETYIEFSAEYCLTSGSKIPSRIKH